MRECQVNTHRGGTPQMGVRERVQGEFQIIWDTLRSNVEAMPESLMDFAPEGLETRSFRAIALHAANASVMFGENIGRGVWERIEAYPAERVVSKAQVLVSMREAGQRFLAGLARLTDDEARRVVRAPWGAEWPQGMLVAGHIPHLFYHNGQLAIYLRMRGVRPLFISSPAPPQA
jgi:uncharacterized damage-inducible protein DinB